MTSLPSTDSHLVPSTVRVTLAAPFVLEALAQLPPGPQRDSVFDGTGVSDALLATPHARVSAEQFAALWLNAVRVLDDEFFGLDTRQMRSGSFALLCRSIIAARTLGQAMNRLLRGFELFLVDVRGELLSDGDEARLLVHTRHTDVTQGRVAQELFITIVHSVLCWLAGQRVTLTHAHFSYARPAHADEYGTAFSKQCTFEAPVTTMVFDSAWLGHRVMQNESTLKQFLALSPLSLLVKYRRPRQWSDRVRALLQATDPAAWPALKDVAARFCTTVTTLTRRLAEEGTRYQSIKDDLRRGRAITLLEHSDLSVDDIAAELGYEDPRTFYRSFRRWTGSAPGAFRQAGATRR